MKGNLVTPGCRRPYQFAPSSTVTSRSKMSSVHIPNFGLKGVLNHQQIVKEEGAQSGTSGNPGMRSGHSWHSDRNHPCLRADIAHENHPIATGEAKSAGETPLL